MLYSWTVSLPDEAKITEAYRMLKLQGERGDPSLQNCSKSDTRHDSDVQIYEGTLHKSAFPRCLLFVVLLLLGVVLADPEIPLDAALVPPASPPSINPVFTDEKKSKVSMCRETKPLLTPDGINLSMCI